MYLMLYMLTITWPCYYYGCHKCQHLYVYVSVNFSRAALTSCSSLHPGMLSTVEAVLLISTGRTAVGKEWDIQGPVCSGFHHEVAFWWLTILLVWHFRSWRAGECVAEALSAHPGALASWARKYHSHKQILEEGQYWTLKLWGVNLALPSVRSKSQGVQLRPPFSAWGAVSWDGVRAHPLCKTASTVTI